MLMPRLPPRSLRPASPGSGLGLCIGSKLPGDPQATHSTPHDHEMDPKTHLLSHLLLTPVPLTAVLLAQMGKLRHGQPQ